MNFIYQHLEIMVAIAGGAFVFSMLFLKSSKSSSNDLTPLYIKYKKHTDNINKSSKSIF